MKEKVKEIQDLLILLNGDHAPHTDILPLVSIITNKIKNVICDSDGNLSITREILEEFKSYNIDISMYNEYSDMVIYAKYKDIGMEITRVQKKELISHK